MCINIKYVCYGQKNASKIGCIIGMISEHWIRPENSLYKAYFKFLEPNFIIIKKYKKQTMNGKYHSISISVEICLLMSHCFPDWFSLISFLEQACYLTVGGPARSCNYNLI